MELPLAISCVRYWTWILILLPQHSKRLWIITSSFEGQSLSRSPLWLHHVADNMPWLVHSWFSNPYGFLCFPVEVRVAVHPWLLPQWPIVSCVCWILCCWEGCSQALGLSLVMGTWNGHKYHQVWLGKEHGLTLGATLFMGGFKTSPLPFLPPPSRSEIEFCSLLPLP